MATYLKDDNSSYFYIPAVLTESQVLYSFIIIVRVDTPIFLFSYLLFIALKTNLAIKHSVVFCSSCHHFQ